MSAAVTSRTPIAEWSDADLVLASADDPAAFGVIIERHQAFVFGAALRVTRNHALAEDIAQDTFLRAHRALADYRGDGELRGWLYRIATNLALNAVSRRREHPAAEIPDTVDLRGSPESELLRSFDVGRVRSAISRLPDALRVPLVLREYHDATYEEIAARLSIPLNTVRSRIHRARSSLQTMLEVPA